MLSTWCMVGDLRAKAEKVGLAGDGKESPQSSGEKRKAGVEASGVHVSTSHVSLANGAKRRLSPEPEVSNWLSSPHLEMLWLWNATWCTHS